MKEQLITQATALTKRCEEIADRMPHLDASEVDMTRLSLALSRAMDGITRTFAGLAHRATERTYWQQVHDVEAREQERWAAAERERQAQERAQSARTLGAIRTREAEARQARGEAGTTP